VSNVSVNAHFLRALATFSAVLLAASMQGVANKAASRYPNELRGFRFYAEYLDPLEPGRSDPEAVRRVLGDTAAVRRDGWTIYTYYTTKGGPLYNSQSGSPHEIALRPDGVIPMSAVKYSPRFDHCHMWVSEINIWFDVYSDTSGLEYWLHEDNSQWGSKGDLYQIVYGPRRGPLPPNTFC